MRQHRPINMVVHYPKTDATKLDFAKRVAEIHADAVNARIKELNCPTAQKLQLLDAVIATARHKNT